MPGHAHPVEEFLKRLDVAIQGDAVEMSDDALETAGVQFGWGFGEVIAVLMMLEAADYADSMPSDAPEGGRIWVFTPTLTEGRVWIRLCERGKVVVVSFHRG